MSSSSLAMARTRDAAPLPQFITVLEANYTTIRRELEQLDFERDFIDWPQRDAYAGRWSVFPLFFPAEPYLPVDVELNRRRCPESTRILRGIPTLVGAGFSLLGPSTRVHAHRDHYAEGVVRCHLALIAPFGARLCIGTRDLVWEEGRCLVFDGQEEHEALNASDRARVVLLADFFGL